MRKHIFYLGILGIILSTTLGYAAETIHIQLSNHTNRPLCIYTGNNLLTCHFMPNSTVDVQLPTQMIYHRQPITNESLTITDVGVVNSTGDKYEAMKIRTNITLCQKRTMQSFADTDKWDVEEGNESGCVPAPQYVGDRPSSDEE